MDKNNLNNLGPLAMLAGTWEGVTGNDTAPSDDRGTEENKYRERMILETISPAENHEQKLQGLRYHTEAWRIGESTPFHDEIGYWLWDADANQVMKCVLIPRGVSLIAGGKVDRGATRFKLTAQLGSTCFGICSNPFLDQEFKTLGFELEMILEDGDTFSYEQVTKIQIKGQKEVFQHKDKNRLKRVK